MHVIKREERKSPERTWKAWGARERASSISPSPLLLSHPSYGLQQLLRGILLPSSTDIRRKKSRGHFLWPVGPRLGSAKWPTHNKNTQEIWPLYRVTTNDTTNNEIKHFPMTQHSPSYITWDNSPVDVAVQQMLFLLFFWFVYVFKF